MHRPRRPPRAVAAAQGRVDPFAGEGVEEVGCVAHERGTTYVLIGAPKPRSPLRRLTQPALPFRLLALLPGVDLRIVADRTQRATEEP